MDGTKEIAPSKSESFFDYDFAKTEIVKLNGSWDSDIISQVENNRKLRKYNFDVEELRNYGVLKPDETFVPVRLIKNAVNRFKARPLSFINNTKYLAIFQTDTPDQEVSDNERLSKVFTKGLRYRNWLSDHVRLIDSVGLNGIGLLEVSFDISKPLHVALDFVALTDIAFPKDTKTSIQDAEYIVKRFNVSIVKLRSFVEDFGFPEDAVNEVIAATKGTDDSAEITNKKSSGSSNITIYRLYFKNNEGIVYTAWFSPCLKSWLKAPEMLYIGRDIEVSAPPEEEASGIEIIGAAEDTPPLPPTYEPMPEYQYPFFSLSIEETENCRILDVDGLAQEIEPAQEAVSTLASAYVNGSIRSVEFIGFPEDAGDVAGAEPKQLEYTIQYGKFFDRKMGFKALPSPSPEMLRGAQFLMQNQANEQSEIQFTVSNRPDARKTKKELELAQNKEEQLKSETEANVINFYEDIFGFTWEIVSNRAQNGKLDIFTQAELEQVAQKWSIVFAAKLEIIEREREQAQLRNDIQLAQGTPLGQEMLVDIVKGTYPDKETRYIGAIQKQNQMDQKNAALVQIIQSALEEGRFADLPPEELKQLEDLLGA